MRKQKANGRIEILRDYKPTFALCSFIIIILKTVNFGWGYVQVRVYTNRIYNICANVYKHACTALTPIHTLTAYTI